MNKWFDFIYFFTSTIFLRKLAKISSIFQVKNEHEKRGFIAECQMKTTLSPCEYDSVAAVTMHPSIWTTRTCRGRDSASLPRQRGRTEETEREKDRKKINQWNERCFKRLCAHRMNLEHVCVCMCKCASACVSKCKCAGGGFVFSNVVVGCWALEVGVYTLEST